MGAGANMLSGVLRYEALTALRQRLLWVILCPLAILIALAAATSPAAADARDGGAAVAVVALAVSALYTLGVAVALADCVARQREGFGELLDTTPTGPSRRLLGTIAGPLAVALVPAAGVVVLAGVASSIGDGSLAPLRIAVVAFLTTVLPGAWALTALAVLLGLVVPLVVARIATVALWCWATLATPGLLPLPTITGTILSPLGGYPAVVWGGAPGRGPTAAPAVRCARRRTTAPRC